MRVKIAGKIIPQKSNIARDEYCKKYSNGEDCAEESSFSDEGTNYSDSGVKASNTFEELTNKICNLSVSEKNIQVVKAQDFDSESNLSSDDTNSDEDQGQVEGKENLISRGPVFNIKDVRTPTQPYILDGRSRKGLYNGGTIIAENQFVFDTPQHNISPFNINIDAIDLESQSLDNIEPSILQFEAEETVNFELEQTINALKTYLGKDDTFGLDSTHSPYQVTGSNPHFTINDLSDSVGENTPTHVPEYSEYSSSIGNSPYNIGSFYSNTNSPYTDSDYSSLQSVPEVNISNTSSPNHENFMHNIDFMNMIYSMENQSFNANDFNIPQKKEMYENVSVDKCNRNYQPDIAKKKTDYEIPVDTAAKTDYQLPVDTIKEKTNYQLLADTTKEITDFKLPGIDTVKRQPNYQVAADTIKGKTVDYQLAAVSVKGQTDCQLTANTVNVRNDYKLSVNCSTSNTQPKSVVTMNNYSTSQKLTSMDNKLLKVIDYDDTSMSASLRLQTKVRDTKKMLEVFNLQYSNLCLDIGNDTEKFKMSMFKLLQEKQNVNNDNWLSNLCAHINYMDCVLNKECARILTSKQNGKSLLFIACLNQSDLPIVARYIAEMMVKHNRSVNEGYSDEYGLSLIHVLACKGDSHLRLMTELLQVKKNDIALLDINGTKNKFLFSPLHVAVNAHLIKNSCFSTVKYLIENGAKISKDFRDKTPLDYALEADCDLNIVEQLLSAKGLNVDSQDAQGNTALHLAYRNKNMTFEKREQVISLLLTKGANPNITNYKNERPSYDMSFMNYSPENIIKNISLI